MGNIIGVCISKEKGTAKKNIGSCEFIKDFGLKEDGHAVNGNAKSAEKKKRHEEFRVFFYSFLHTS